MFPSQFVALFCVLLTYNSLEAKLQTSLNCNTVDANSPECCDLDPANACFIRSVKRPLDGCTVACQRRYQTLGWQCYMEHKESYFWEIMQANCDPQSIFVFEPPRPTRPPPAPVFISEAFQRGSRGGFIVVTTCLFIGLIDATVTAGQDGVRHLHR